MRVPERRMMIVAENLGKTYETGGRDLTVLDGVDLAVESEEFLTILGPSGSGKTTLLGLLAGLDRPTTGRVVLDGQDITDLTEDQRAGFRVRKVGFVFQTFHLLPTLTAVENVMVPIELLGGVPLPGGRGDAATGGAGGTSDGSNGSRRGDRRRDPIRDRAAELLARVGLSDRLSHFPAQLSGGEQQRVALARAFVNAPRILFADEPTGNLDRETGAGVVALLDELNRASRTTLVLVTHDEDLAGRAHRVVRLEGGRLVSDERR